jgi:hypothetical protein
VSNTLNKGPLGSLEAASVAITTSYQMLVYIPALVPGVILHQLAKLEAGTESAELQIELADIRDKAKGKLAALADEGPSAHVRFAAALERITHFYPAALDALRDKVITILPRCVRHKAGSRRSLKRKGKYRFLHAKELSVAHHPCFLCFD